MPNFIDINYDTLSARESRIENFFNDLNNKLSTLSAPSVYHQEIYYDGAGNVRRILDDEKIQNLSLFQRQKYYNQGVGLMKLAMNKILYPS